ncbi:uncharacterized protein LOC108036930 [Drosophila rhopaloa]|uniref:Uncharacterized protein n=2 Tax=Drosophila rhopaloa TaxID=1041015 RepID=A0ABM5GT63_DRORH|nr:uncharacterized protein LOC108036930 [Drosophila rhopaloa]
MWNSSCRDVRLPSAKMMIHQVQAVEEDAEEPALEFHENCNQAWRAQFRHPGMANVAIGFEFMNAPSRHMTFSLSTQDDDTENQLIGNSSSSTSQMGPTPQISQLEYLPYMFSSEGENLMQHLS